MVVLGAQPVEVSVQQASEVGDGGGDLTAFSEASAGAVKDAMGMGVPQGVVSR
ncbi:hypothetical protein M877_28370 [Streptomyces niveus NCIMB 11891]|nr:hypothetical protein M877_28370 [Streptomyces niveus NCIMB 11891]